MQVDTFFLTLLLFAINLLLINPRNIISNIIMLLNINATHTFILFLTILNQKDFRITTVAMFTCDLYAGVVPQMSPPPHDLERLCMNMVDFIVIFNRGRSVVDFVRVAYFIPLNGPLNGHPPSLY